MQQGTLFPVPQEDYDVIGSNFRMYIYWFSKYFMLLFLDYTIQYISHIFENEPYRLYFSSIERCPTSSNLTKFSWTSRRCGLGCTLVRLEITLATTATVMETVFHRVSLRRLTIFTTKELAAQLSLNWISRTSENIIIRCGP